MLLKLAFSILAFSFLLIKGCSNESCEDQYTESRKIRQGEKEWDPYTEGEERIFLDSVGNRIKLMVYFKEDTFYHFQKDNYDFDSGCEWTAHRKRHYYYTAMGIDLNRFQVGTLRYDLMLRIGPRRYPYYYGSYYGTRTKEGEVSLEIRTRENEWHPEDNFEVFSSFFINDSIYSYGQREVGDIVKGGRLYRDVISMRFYASHSIPLDQVFFNKEYGIIRLNIEDQGMFWLQ